MNRFVLPSLVVIGCAATPGAAVAPTVAPTAAPETSGVSGVVDLGDGLRARYQHDFDRDALARVVAAGDGVIAVTGAGTLLGFDRDLALAREQVVSPPVAVLAGDGGGPIFAGLIDGTLVTVDPRTLDLTRIGAIAGRPLWMHASADRLLVVAARDGDRVVYRLSLADPSRVPPPIVMPRDGAGGASVWLVDDRDRLWYGADHGEWGGEAGSIDLASGAASKTIKLDDGVTGLVARGDVMWAYGGTTHMGYVHGSITALDGDVARPVWSAGPDDDDVADPPGSPPRLPITRITERAGRLRVIAWNELYDVDAALTTWTRIAAVPARVHWGRPDAVGAYPAIQDVLTLPDGDLVLATARDGLFRVRGDAVTAHAIRDPLDGGIARITTAGRALVATAGAAIYRRVDDRWEPLALPAALAELFELNLVTAPGRPAHLIIDPDPISPGPMVTARWDGGAVVTLGRQDEGPSIQPVVALDDALWAIDWGTLWRWDPAAATWRTAGHYDHRDFSETNGLSIGYQLEAVAAGAGWLIHDLDLRALLRLTVDRAGAATLTAVLAGQEIDDAIAWDGGQVLVATARGLRVLDPATARTVAAPPPRPADRIYRLARDRDGLLWLSTEHGLFVVDGARLRAIAIPALTGRPIVDLTADPDGGVAVALAAGGVMQIALDVVASPPVLRPSLAPPPP